jgi:nucleoid-associated protein YgaU
VGKVIVIPAPEGPPGPATAAAPRAGDARSPALSVPTAAQAGAPAQPAPTRPAPSPAAPVSAGRKHIVKPGDTLSSIAARTLGSRAKWSAIFEANRDKLASPDALEVGMELVIPAP